MDRGDIINRFIAERGYESFLEIGTAHGETFRKITCADKVSVDPSENTEPTFRMTSDEYFKKCRRTFDVVFVDGLHEHDQAYRDIQNALKHINPKGIIVVHDCHPTDELMQKPYTSQHFWTGDVWKAFVKCRAELPYECYVIDQDFGCGVIDTSRRKRKSTAKLPTDMDAMTYQDFVNHPEWMDFRQEP